MATLTISDSLYAQLKIVAARQEQSVEEYAHGVLESAASSERSAETTPLTRDEQLQRVRDIMADQIWTQKDVNDFFEELGIPEMTVEEAEQIIATIPPLDPPLSLTVIEMREEERY